MRIAIAAVSVSLALPSWAQTLDCLSPTTQIEITGCAAQAHGAADGDLNLAWSMAMDAAHQQDQYIDANDVPSAQMLRDAQRTWISFRDRACAAESTLARGGSMQNQILYICLERLTRQRTEDLRIFSERN